MDLIQKYGYEGHDQVMIKVMISLEKYVISTSKYDLKHLC